MKTNLTLLQISMLGLLLTVTTLLFGQTGPAPIPTVTPPIATFGGLQVGTYNDGTGAVVSSMADAVLFYHPTNTSITLQASEQDANGMEFDLYVWYKITNADGSENTPLVGEVSRTLTQENLEPGFHRYRVYGIVESASGTNCNSEEFQDIVIFVLNSLNPTVETAVDAVTQMCISDTLTDGILNTAISFASTYGSGDLPKPGAGDFEYTYTYYAIKDGDTNTKIPIGSVTASGATNSIDLDYDTLKANGIGTYTFFVEVTYSSGIKDSTGKDYAIWTSQVQRDGVNYQLEVTPQPGRPTITIIGSSDGV